MVKGSLQGNRILAVGDETRTIIPTQSFVRRIANTSAISITANIPFAMS